MKKYTSLLATFLLVFSLSGCFGARTTGVGLRFYSNTLTIFNSSDFYIRIIINGQELQGLLPPSRYITRDLWRGIGNYNISHRVNIIITTKHRGAFYTIERQFYVSTYQSENQTLVVRNEDFGFRS